MAEGESIQGMLTAQLKDYSQNPVCVSCGKVLRRHGFARPGEDITREILNYSPKKLAEGNIRVSWPEFATSVTNRFIHIPSPKRCDPESLRFGPNPGFFTWSRLVAMGLYSLGLSYPKTEQLLAPSKDPNSATSAYRAVRRENPNFERMEALHRINRERFEVAVDMAEKFPTVWVAQIRGEKINFPTYAYLISLSVQSLLDIRGATIRVTLPH